MKQKFFFFTLGLILLLGTGSCGDDMLTCNNVRVKQTLHELLYEKGEPYLVYAGGVFNMRIPKDSFKDFCMNRVKIDMVRTLSRDKELKRCRCAAQLHAVFRPDIQQKFDSLKRINPDMASLMKPVDITYSIQETDDEQVLVELETDDEDCVTKLMGLFAVEEFLKQNSGNKNLEETD